MALGVLSLFFPPLSQNITREKPGVWTQNWSFRQKGIFNITAWVKPEYAVQNGSLLLVGGPVWLLPREEASLATMTNASALVSFCHRCAAVWGRSDRSSSSSSELRHACGAWIRPVLFPVGSGSPAQHAAWRRLHVERNEPKADVDLVHTGRATLRSPRWSCYRRKSDSDEWSGCATDKAADLLGYLLKMKTPKMECITVQKVPGQHPYPHNILCNCLCEYNRWGWHHPHTTGTSLWLLSFLGIVCSGKQSGTGVNSIIPSQINLYVKKEHSAVVSSNCFFAFVFF